MGEERFVPLSERELELVRLLSEGLSNREIASRLYISPNTVKVHLRNIYGKLGVSSRTEATMVAVRMGWVQVGQPQADRGVIEQAPPPAAIPAAEPALEPEPEPPLALWQRIYLVCCVLLAALGLWLIWPGGAERPGPFTDRPAQTLSWNPGQVLRWTSLAQMPTPRNRLAVVAHEGRIYAIAGEGASGVSGAVEIYDPDADDWARGADKPTPVANVGAVVLGGKVYVPGGSTSDGQVSDRLAVYDPGTGSPGTWTTGERMPRGLFAYALAAYKGDLYLFGGWDGSSYVSESYRYQPQADAWSTLAPMTTPRAFAGAGTIGDYVYVVGGYDGEEELATCEVYDPQRDSWATCPLMSAPRGGAGVAVIADTLYAIGGGWDSYLVENEIFSPDPSDPVQGSWQTFPSPLLQEWRNLGVAVNGTFLYAIGGWDGGFLSVNQVYRALYRLYLPMGRGGKSASE